MSIRNLAVFLALACIPNGTIEYGGRCWGDADCVEDLVCYDWECITEEGEEEARKEAQEAQEAGDDDDGGGIICNDGSRSPTCTTCSSGCCSGHDGCE